MYLYLGEDTVTAESGVVGVFDIENTSVSKHTKEFLAASERKRNVVNVNYEMPKSFVVCESKGRERVYISPVSAATIKKRASSSFATANEKREAFQRLENMRGGFPADFDPDKVIAEEREKKYGKAD